MKLAENKLQLDADAVGWLVDLMQSTVEYLEEDDDNKDELRIARLVLERLLACRGYEGR